MSTASKSTAFAKSFGYTTGYDRAVENGVQRMKDGRLTPDEVNDILAHIRIMLEMPGSTMRNDAIEDNNLCDYTRTVLTTREVLRNSGRLVMCSINPPSLT